jgi:hypothetical protein
MRTAVTNHAVDRYRDRVDGANGFERESIRERIREIVEEGFKENAVRDHPTERDRRIIPFKSGESILFLSIGPNTTTFEADLAVISVLYERELTDGRKGGLGTLDEVAPQLKEMKVEAKWDDIIVFVGEPGSIEWYSFASREELQAWTDVRKPERFSIYRLDSIHPVVVR